MGIDAAKPSSARVGAVAALLGASIALSRLIGYAREAVLADRLGIASGADAYRAAFQLPDLLNYLLAGGALSIAFVPLYTRMLERRGESAARQLYGTVLGTVGAAALAATAVAWLYADVFVAYWYAGFDSQTQALTVRLTRIVLPAQVFFLTGGIVRAVLMARGRFGAHALAPLVYNLCIIAGGIATGSAEGFAWGVLVGAFVGPFLLPLLDARRFELPTVRIAPLDGGFRSYFMLALPLMLGLGLTTVDEWYERFFGSRLAEGTVAMLGYARLLMLAPVGVIGQAFAVAVLPTLAQLHVRGAAAELDRLLSRTLRGALALSLLAAAALWTFAAPAVEVLYRHGRFDGEAATQVVALLRIFAFAVPAWVLQQVTIRAFFAREEMWRPMLLNTVMALAALPIYAGLAQASGATGLALAAVIAIAVNALATLAWVRTRFGGPLLAPVAATAARSLLVACACAAAATVLMQVEGLPRGGDLGAALELAVGGAAFGLVAWVGVALIGDETMRSGARRIGDGLARRLGRRRGRG